MQDQINYKYNTYYNLDNSPIFVEQNRLLFYFSSELLKDAFVKKLENLEVDKKIFETKYQCTIETLDFLLFRYYKRTEKRGFRITDKNGKNINEINLKLIF